MSIELENNVIDGPSSYVLPGPTRDALYDLLTELCEIDEAEDGQLSDYEKFELNRRRESIYERLLAKTDRLAAFIRQQDAEYDRINAEVLRLREWRGRIDRERERLKMYVIHSMRATDTKALRTPTAKISLRKIKPSVQIVDQKAIPERFWVTPPGAPYPSKEKIAAALDANEDVPGVKREAEAYTLVIA